MQKRRARGGNTRRVSAEQKRLCGLLSVDFLCVHCGYLVQTHTHNYGCGTMMVNYLLIISLSFTVAPPFRLLSSAASMNAYISRVSLSSTGVFFVRKNS